MATMSGSPRGSRLGLYVGVALTVSAALPLAGTGLWLALAAPRTGHASPIALVVLAVSVLASLTGAAIALSAMRREPAYAPRADDRALGEAADSEPTSRERAAALAHAQKMEALGLLAGGVAHDFNNLLHIIGNSLEILQRQDPPTDARRYLEMIRRSADRATALTRQLLAFSRPQPLEPRPLDPNDLVLQVTELLRHSLGDRILIQTLLDRMVWTIAADAGQLETALLNLAINARDAMSQEGVLTIETANAPPDDSGAAAHVMISVSDTGTGMPPEVAARACEPFFTTKEPGQGTGLGLSQVADFAQQSGGYLRISSAPGRGTTVRLYLPKSVPRALSQSGADFSKPLTAAPPPPKRDYPRTHRWIRPSRRTDVGARALVQTPTAPKNEPGSPAGAGCGMTLCQSESLWR